MNAGDRVFLQFEGAIHGPYTIAQMRELAEGMIITPRTPAGPAASGPWQPLETLPHGAEVFPAKAARAFKPAAFEDLNQPGTAPVAPPMAILSVGRDAGLALKPRDPSAPPAMANEVVAADAPPNDVRAMVNEVGEIERRLAPELPLRRPWRMSGRLKVVLVLAALGNGVVFSIPIFYDATDYLSEAILSAWTVIYNGGLVAIYVQLPKD